MGWVAIPLALLGLAALSSNNSTQYASYTECSYAAPAYGYQQPVQSYSYGYQSLGYSGQSAYGYAPQPQYQGYAAPQANVYGGDDFTGVSYDGGGGYGASAGISY